MRASKTHRLALAVFFLLSLSSIVPAAWYLIESSSYRAAYSATHR
jgi:hypothetical protein